MYEYPDETSITMMEDSVNKNLDDRNRKKHESYKLDWC